MLGGGVVNCVNPTSGVLMAVLAASGIPYVKWLRFMNPLALIWFVIGLVFICIGVLIKWGVLNILSMIFRFIIMNRQDIMKL